MAAISTKKGTEKRAADTTRVLKRALDGVVVRVSGAKTVSVEVTRVSRHSLYGKKVVTTKRYLVHDEAETAQVGDAVRIEECRPLSRRKRWTLVVR